MKNVDDLIDSAAELATQGLSKGEIADELNVSRETASWLVERGGTDTTPETGTPAGPAEPDDVHVDWSAIGRDSDRLGHVSAALADLMASEADVDLTVGIEKAGVPIATTVANTLGTDLSTYAPRKHQWDDDDMNDLGGTFSRNFAKIRGRDCYVVDDTITSGTTMRETVTAIQEEGGNPVGCAVLADKHGLDEIEGVPVHSLLQVIRVGDSR